ncbi:hypothetical protein TDB9533_03280 [Thalassocella blandensis]|nr:hypothetical protein TDB9533_03280 [Thalassocella blandensis]
MNSATPPFDNILLASQGIYDRQRRLFGTELLFRNEHGHSAMDVGESTATSEVLINHCSSITHEIEHLNRPAFVNVTADFLLSEAFLPVDPTFIVIELVERIDVNSKVINAVKAWKNHGFRFALDDFEFDSSWDPLVEMADIVKIDVLDQDFEDIYQRKTYLHDRFDCRWLAERVETEEEFNIYHQQGFDLFQGYFLGKPKSITGKTIRPEQASAAEILRVTNTDADIDEIAKVVGRDPALSLQILKIINSSLYSLPREVDSIKQAVVFLGIDQLRKWAVVISLLKASRTSIEAHRLVLNRAKFCELYSRASGENNPDRAFIVGLLSGIQILLNVDTLMFLDKISVSEEIRAAVLNRDGALGKMLSLALNLERIINMRADTLQQNSRAILDSYHQAFHWTEEILRSLK